MTKAQVEAQIHKISKMTPDEAAAYRSTVSTSNASDKVKNWLWEACDIIIARKDRTAAMAENGELDDLEVAV